MTRHWSWAKILALTAAVLVCGSAAAMLGYRQEVSESRLGSEWRCTRTAFFVTTCTHSEESDSRGASSFRERLREVRD